MYNFSKDNSFTYHPISLLRELAKYDQNVYAPSLSGYNNLKVSTKPVAKKSVISSRSSLVNPAFLVFVLGFFKSKKSMMINYNLNIPKIIIINILHLKLNEVETNTLMIPIS